jgi:hypothetical protein
MQLKRHRRPTLKPTPVSAPKGSAVKDVSDLSPKGEA